MYIDFCNYCSSVCKFKTSVMKVTKLNELTLVIYNINNLPVCLGRLQKALSIQKLTLFEIIIVKVKYL